MLLKILFFITFLTAANAYMIPEGTEDGVYEHHIDEDGKEVHIKLANITEIPKVDIGPYTERPKPQNGVRGLLARAVGYTCGSALNLNHADTDAANANLDWQCDNYPPTQPRRNFYAIRGINVAFYCNFNHYSERKCSSGERQFYSSRITAYCDWYNSGWYNGDDGIPTWSYGYDRGRCFCGGCVP